MSLGLVAGILGALGVAMGAFGAHGLKASLPPDLMAIYHTGNQYHVYHSLGLFAVTLASGFFPGSRLIGWSGGCILAGIVLFSGSLYVLSLTGQRWIGAITPFGGMAFLAGLAADGCRCLARPAFLNYRMKRRWCSHEQYREIDRHCKEKGIAWIVSVGDEPSVDFMEKFDTPATKCHRLH